MRPSLTYLAGLALALLTPAFLVILIGAVGLIGVEGDRFDRLYLIVLAVEAAGILLARFKAPGMSMAMLVAAATQSGITGYALAINKQASPVSSVEEIIGVNAIFVIGFILAAFLFRLAAAPPSAAARTQ